MIDVCFPTFFVFNTPMCCGYGILRVNIFSSDNGQGHCSWHFISEFRPTDPYDSLLQRDLRDWTFFILCEQQRWIWHFGHPILGKSEERLIYEQRLCAPRKHREELQRISRLSSSNCMMALILRSKITELPMLNFTSVLYCLY